jgi:hypothetical protein
MVMKQHVMIDIETIGTEDRAPILSIGAVYFDPRETDNLGQEFYVNVDLHEQIDDAYRMPSGKTIKWWFAQSSMARAALFQDEVAVEEALKSFNEFLQYDHHEGSTYLPGPHHAVVGWANGVSFDFNILKSLYQDCYTDKWPLTFRNEACMRALRHSCDTADVVKPNHAAGAATHNALDDAKYQARWVQNILKELKK